MRSPTLAETASIRLDTRPGEGGPTRVDETHVSVLLFVGEHVYKLKKNVHESFVDLSTRARRLEVCRREVELNRRLAPDVYEGVVLLPTASGAEGEPAVLMKRLPDERRLSRLLERTDEAQAALGQVARKLVEFHARAATSAEIGAAATRAAIEERWRANLAGLDRFVGDVLSHDTVVAVRSAALRYVEGRGPLFEQRVEAGRVRDGHGDVLADDIFCLDDGPRIIDCLEFDDRLRYVDVIDDCSTLVMDLERLGRPDLAEAFLHHYLALSRDDAPWSLLHHYVAYRATVRAKVACLRFEQGREGADDEARRLFEIARKHLTLATVNLVLIGGPPGSGKSTLARDLAAATGWTVLRSDVVRRALRPDAARPAAYGTESFSRDAGDSTYDKMLRDAVHLMGLGRSVILDATWHLGQRREAAASVARMTSTHLTQLRCEVTPDEAVARVRRRLREGSDVSVATVEVARRLAREFEAWPEAAAIDTEVPRTDSLAAALEQISSSAEGGAS